MNIKGYANITETIPSGFTVVEGNSNGGGFSFRNNKMKILWLSVPPQEDFEIDFHNLFAITNLPISRFLDYLIASENYEEYMYSLVEAYNPVAVENVMCTNTLSISWDGWLYDCDFNQMLNLKVNSSVKHISEYNEELLLNRNISINQHCYGCTAGAGSSCQGVVA